MKYLVCLEGMGCPPCSYRKLVNTLDAALSLIVKSTGWDYYEVYECEIAKEYGHHENMKATEDTQYLTSRLVEGVEPQMSWGIYGEYTRPGIPWRSSDCLFFDDEAYTNKCFESYKEQDYQFLAVLKIGKQLCNWTKDDMAR